MNLKQIVQTDSSKSLKDSSKSITKTQILIPESVSDQQMKSGKYPEANNINRQLTPDWILCFSLAYIVSLAWMRLIYSKYITWIFKSAVNFQLAPKLYAEPGIVKRRIFLYLNVFYYLTTGLFLFLVAGYFEYHLTGLNGIRYFFVITAFLISYSLIKMFLMKLTGGLFNQQKIFSEAIFHNLLFNKIISVLITPFLLLIAYTRGFYQGIFVYAGLSVLISITILRFYHGFIFISKSVVSLFYFILYLCTLEILPVLVILKLIFSLSKGT